MHPRSFPPSLEACTLLSSALGFLLTSLLTCLICKCLISEKAMPLSLSKYWIKKKKILAGYDEFSLGILINSKNQINSKRLDYFELKLWNMQKSGLITQHKEFRGWGWKEGGKEDE